MARIPLGDFGNAQLQVRPTPTPGNVDGGLGDAAQRLAQTGMALGEQGINQQRAEADRQQREQQAEARRAAEKEAARAEQIQLLNAHADIQNGLATLSDEIGAKVASGELSKNDARLQWSDGSEKLLADRVGKMPPDLQQLTQAQMKQLAGRLSNGLEDTIRKRDQQVADGGLVAYREQMQRFASTDLEGAVTQWERAVRSAGPGAGWTPDKIEKDVNAFREQVYYTKAYEMVSGARNDRQALDKVGKAIGDMQMLDPQKRATLTDRVEGYKFALDQKAELQAQRAQRQAEAHMKRAEAEFQAFQGVAVKGLALDPAYIDTVVQKTAGTPFQASVRALAQQAATTGGLASQPLAAQRAQLDAITAQIAREGNSAGLQKRRDQLEKVVRGSESDIARDPMRAYLERSQDAADFKPLDVSSIQGLTQSLQQRLPIAGRASAWSGGPVAPLTAEEIEPVRKMLDAMPPAQRAPVIASLATTIGPQAAAGMARQLDKSDRALGLAFAHAGAQTTAGRTVSELILRGAQAKKDGTSTKGKDAPDVKENQWKSVMTTEIDGVFQNQQTTNDIRDSALYIAHGIAAEQGGKLSEDDMRRAMRLAVGGAIVEHNGRKIPLPAGVDEDMLSKRLRSVDAGEITQQAGGNTVRAAGVEVPVADFLKALPGQQLMPVRQGQFAVIVNGRPVTNSRGVPIIIGVR